MQWGKTFLYKCFDAGTSQTAQADIEHGNEPNMSDAKAVKHGKKIGHDNDPEQLAQRVQCVSYHSMLLLCFSIIAHWLERFLYSYWSKIMGDFCRWF